jgi:hypothetical protein
MLFGMVSTDSTTCGFVVTINDNQKRLRYKKWNTLYNYVLLFRSNYFFCEVKLSKVYIWKHPIKLNEYFVFSAYFTSLQ